MAISHELEPPLNPSSMEWQAKGFYYKVFRGDESFDLVSWRDLSLVLNDLGYRVLDGGYGSGFAGLELDKELTIVDRLQISDDYGFRVFSATGTSASLGGV